MFLALGVRLRSCEALWPLSGLHSIRGECLIDRVQYRCEDDVLAIVTANADALDVDYVRKMSMRVILASESPRRAELLKAAGFDIEVIPSRIDEDRHDGEAAEDYVLRVAQAKADVAAHNRKDLPIVAADTIVVLDGHIMGKPKDDDEATRMLRMLGGRTHEVLTGVVVRLGGRQQGHVERTRVRLGPLSPAEIAWYVGTGEPRDKAGAYAVQGLASRFIEEIGGSYTNVVGLPVAAVYRLLRELGQGGSDRLRQGYRGPPKLYAEAEDPPLPIL